MNVCMSDRDRNSHGYNVVHLRTQILRVRNVKVAIQENELLVGDIGKTLVFFLRSASVSSRNSVKAALLDTLIMLLTVMDL